MTSAIAALQAGERHSVEDRDTIRREIRDAEERILKAVDDVDKSCRDFRKEVRDTWTKREQRSAGITVAWIGGVCLLLASIVQTIAVLTGG